MERRVPSGSVRYDRVRRRQSPVSDEGGCYQDKEQGCNPDFEELEEAIRQHPTRRPLEMAIVQSRRVREPVTTRLREFGLRTLSDYAGDPVEAVGTGKTNLLPSNLDFNGILDSLQSGLKGRQLQKRLAKLDLDTPESALRSNWRERLASVQDIRTADSVTAIYKLGRYRFSVPVDGKLDKESGTLWIRSDTDLRGVFFDVIAEHVFELPKKYYGSVLDQAYKMEMRERYPLEYSDGVQPQEDDEIDDTTSQHSGIRVPRRHQLFIQCLSLTRRKTFLTPVPFLKVMESSEMSASLEERVIGLSQQMRILR